MESILTSIKILLGIEPDDNNFDQELIMHINTVLTIMTQLGFNPTSGFFITDASSMWTDFISVRKDLEMIKSYVFLRVRLLFDPPQNSFLVDTIQKQYAEFEWRLNVQIEDTIVEEGVTNGNK